MARLLGTINYEIACDVAARVVRRYRGETPRALTPVARYAATPPTSRRGHPGRASPALGPGEAGWLVGGCLRDELLGRRIRDIDVALDGDPEALARTLADRFGGGVYATSDTFGGWRVVIGDLHIDVAALRGGPPGGPPDPETRALRLEADLRARDVTVDALARPLDGDTIVDPLSGLDDLAAGRLRLCSPASLDDDPLRVLRLARLARVFDLMPDAGRYGGSHPRLVRPLARERRARPRRALLAARHARGAPRAPRPRRCGAPSPSFFPRSTACAASSRTPITTSTSSSTPSRRSRTSSASSPSSAGAGFLTTPAEAGLPGVEPLVPVSWAVLLHDIGKPVVRVVDEQGRVIFWHHDEIGRQMCADIGRRFNFSSRFVEYVGTLVRQHLRLGFLTREQPLTRRALARYRRDVSPWVFESVVVSLCDRLATRGEKTSLASMARHYRLARTVWTAVEQGPGAAAAERRRRDGPARPRPGAGGRPGAGRARGRGRGRGGRRRRGRAGVPRRMVAAGPGGRRRGGQGGGAAGTGPAPRRAMPELPEVETVRRRLLDLPAGPAAARGRGQRLDGRRPDRAGAERVLSPAGAWPGCAAAASTCSWTSGRLTSAGRRQLRRPLVAIVHLRMTGQLVFRREPGERPAALRVALRAGDELFFQDVRRFGRLWALEPAAEDEFFGRASVRSRSGRSSRPPTCAARCGAGARRSSRSCSTSGGSPAWATSTPTRRCSAPGCTRCRSAGSVGPRRGAAPARRPARDAAGRHRPRGLEHRELRRPRGTARQLPGDPERLRAHRRALPDLRHDRRAGRRRRPRHALLPALPAAAAAAWRPAPVAGSADRRLRASAKPADWEAPDRERRGARRSRRRSSSAPASAARPGGPSPRPRLYIVLTRVPRRTALAVGALGTVTLERGWYAYVGSAARARDARVARHLAREKPLRWHADYLLRPFPRSAPGWSTEPPGSASSPARWRRCRRRASPAPLRRRRLPLRRSPRALRAPAPAPRPRGRGARRRRARERGGASLRPPPCFVLARSSGHAARSRAGTQASRYAYLEHSFGEARNPLKP